MRKFIVLFLAALAGCSAKSNSLVVVSVDAEAPIAGVATLHARVGAAARTAEFDVRPVAGGAVAIPPAQSFGIDMPRGMAGAVALHVEARDGAGQLLASGDGSGNINVGGRSDLHITLATLAAAPDMADATADLATTGTPPDMADAADMAHAPAQLVIDHASQSFGDITVGNTSTTASFLITNIGGLPTSMPALTQSGPQLSEFTIATDCAAAIDAGKSCHVTASVTPSSTGGKQAAFHLIASSGGDVSATLSANALPPGTLSIAQPSGDCGSALLGVQSTTVASFTVNNTGSSASGAPTLHVSDPQFVASGCASAVPAGGMCTVTVTFKPSASGTQNASLSVSATPGGTATASLVGVGLKPATLGLAPATGDCGASLLGVTSSTTASFTLANSGDVASGVPTLQSSDGEFVASGCGGAIAAHGSCTVTVRFTPTAAGTRTATLTASTSPGGAPTASLTGVGLKPATLDFSSATGSCGASLIGVTSTTTASFTVTNNGDVATGAPTVSSSNGEFVASGCGGAIAAHGNCTLTVSFTPAARGGRSATVTMSASPGGANHATLSGTGLAPASLSLTPSSFSFSGSTPRLSTGATQAFVVTNSGDVAAAALPAAALSGGQASSFTITSDGCNGAAVGPSPASCSVSVQLAPRVSGALSATLSIGALTATLAGTATPIWVREFTRAGTAKLASVWAADAQHVWAVGDAQLILFRGADGQWVDHSTTFALNQPNYTFITGSGPTDLWAGSDQGLYRSSGDNVWDNSFGGTPIGGIVAFAPNDVWVTTTIIQDNGTLTAPVTTAHHFDGTSYVDETATAGCGFIWATSDTDIYCAYNATSHYDSDPTPFFSRGISHRGSDGKWTSQYTASAIIGPIWGSSAANLYTNEKRPMHSTGNGTWIYVDPSAPTGVKGIWGSGPSDLYFVGPSGIAHTDGTTWPAPYQPNGLAAAGVWGTGANDVYVVGQDNDGICIEHLF